MLALPFLQKCVYACTAFPPEVCVCLHCLSSWSLCVPTLPFLQKCVYACTAFPSEVCACLRCLSSRGVSMPALSFLLKCVCMCVPALNFLQKCVYAYAAFPPEVCVCLHCLSSWSVCVCLHWLSSWSVCMPTLEKAAVQSFDDKKHTAQWAVPRCCAKLWWKSTQQNNKTPTPTEQKITEAVQSTPRTTLGKEATLSLSTIKLFQTCRGEQD